MSTDTAVQPIEAVHQSDASSRLKWWILAVLGLSQLMVVLDATVVNIALPTAQAALHFSNDNRQWVISGYALAFGSLLLVGGRLSDLLGRKRIFIIGAVGFALGSAVGGSAHSFSVLVSARVAQGVFAALLAPAALSLLTTTFTEQHERGRAFGIWGGIAGAGGAFGVLIGGVLTQELSWRWTMFINLPLALAAAVGGTLLLHSNEERERAIIDWPGTVTASAGLFGLVFGLSHAETRGWSNATTIGSIAVGVVLLAVFAFIQTISTHPLLPLRIVLERNRGGSFLALAVAGAALFAVFLFLTYYLQQILGYSPIKTGLAFMPMAGALVVSAGMATTLVLPRVGPRPLVAPGLLVSAGGLVILAQVGVGSSYLDWVLPAGLLIGGGFGFVLAPALNIATAGVEPEDAGVASALANTMQQVGGSIGIALLSTMAGSATTAYLVGKHATPATLAAAAAHGYVTAFWWAAGILAAGSVAIFGLLRGEAPHLTPGVAVDVEADVQLVPGF
jgi:EmrB/QacA subfamily drug resistance transporter